MELSKMKYIIIILLIFVATNIASGQDSLKANCGMDRISKVNLIDRNVRMEYLKNKIDKKTLEEELLEDIEIDGWTIGIDGMFLDLILFQMIDNKSLYHNIIQPTYRIGIGSLIYHNYGIEGVGKYTFKIFCGLPDLGYYGGYAFVKRKNGFDSDSKHGYAHMYGWLIPWNFKDKGELKPAHILVSNLIGIFATKIYTIAKYYINKINF